MAKEFDIYLSRRLTECDIIVYSIPYREGLTVMERLILQTCLESYTLQKFIAIESGSELTAHIDEMIKICYEKLNNPIVIDTSADFEVHYALNPVPSSIVIQADISHTLCNTFAAAQNILELYASPILAQTKKSFGRGYSNIELSSELKNSLKNAIEKAYSQVETGTRLDGIKKLGVLQVPGSIQTETVLTDLLYRVYTMASGAISLAAETLKTEIHFSLGSGSSQLETIDVLVGEQIKKQESVKACLGLLSELSELLLLCINPEIGSFELVANVTAIVKRHRLLTEMDLDKISIYNDTPLDEVDYVILQG